VFGFRIECRERLAHQRDVLREIVLLDVAVRPDAVDQLALRDHAAGVLHQKSERVERLAGKRDLAGAGGEDSLLRIGSERAEAVRLHRSFSGDSAGSHDFGLSPRQIVTTETSILLAGRRDSMRSLFRSIVLVLLVAARLDAASKINGKIAF